MALALRLRILIDISPFPGYPRAGKGENWAGFVLQDPSAEARAQVLPGEARRPGDFGR